MEAVAIVVFILVVVALVGTVLVCHRHSAETYGWSPFNIRTALAILAALLAFVAAMFSMPPPESAGADVSVLVELGGVGYSLNSIVFGLGGLVALGLVYRYTGSRTTWWISAIGVTAIFLIELTIVPLLLLFLAKRTLNKMDNRVR